jgi:DNA-binding NtrC family response regulator
MSHALVVDDDIDAAELLAELIRAGGFTVEVAHSLRHARARLAIRTPDILFVDLVLPDGKGISLLQDEQLRQDAEMVLITGHASLETSIEALRLGAADYLVKPVSGRQVLGILSRLTPPSALNTEIAIYEQELNASGRFGSLWGRSDAMRRVYEQVSRVAVTSVTVLIEGESGTGKELVARTVHDLSRRRERNFLAINCGAISPQLMESEIFGHEKGSFTGADRLHRGFFERADGGTLLLDEITEMPANLQVKLLRVLETATFQRVGSTDERRTDVRVLAATNRVPLEAVMEGRLREDLLYRLNVFPIRMPPLRDRIEDVPLLADHFLEQVGTIEGKARHFTANAYAALLDYHWPGNVRELRNAVHRAYIMAPGSEVSSDWLNLGGSAVRPDELRIPVGTRLADVERELILATLARNDGQRELTAAELGISVKSLLARLKSYGADDEDAVPPAASTLNRQQKPH